MKKEILTQSKTLFISAGHSNSDPGAAGNEVTESDIVLEFRNLVAAELSWQIEFEKDGEQGQNLPLREAVKRAQQHDVAVEFHCNAAANSQATGTETLSQPHNFALGRSLCSTISSVLGIANRGAKPEGSGQHSRLAFVSDGGGIIVELFFLTNSDDLAAYHRFKSDLAAQVATVLASSVCDAW